MQFLFFKKHTLFVGIEERFHFALACLGLTSFYVKIVFLFTFLLIVLRNIRIGQGSANVVKMPSPVKFKAVSAGNFHSMFLAVEGRVWGCGIYRDASLALPHNKNVSRDETWQEKAERVTAAEPNRWSILIFCLGNVLPTFAPVPFVYLLYSN